MTIMTIMTTQRGSGPGRWSAPWDCLNNEGTTVRLRRGDGVVPVGLLDARFEDAGQVAGQRTGFLDHPNGVASGRYFRASP
jgi:hypothetical protein